MPDAGRRQPLEVAFREGYGPCDPLRWARAELWAVLFMLKNAARRAAVHAPDWESLVTLRAAAASQAPCASASSRVTEPSSRPSVAAKPLLVEMAENLEGLTQDRIEEVFHDYFADAKLPSAEEIGAEFERFLADQDRKRPRD